MKKVFLLLSFLLGTTFFSMAQRFAYVDAQYILDNIPEYADAQKKLDAVSAGWQKEIEAKYKEIDGLYKSYQQEQVLLTDEMKKQRQTEIENKENAVKEFQKNKYGPDGDLFKQRQELIKPIQDKVYDAVTKLATSKAYDFIFDKSGGVSMLYANPKLDLSDDVIKALGYTPKTGDNTTPQKK